MAPIYEEAGSMYVREKGLRELTGKAVMPGAKPTVDLFLPNVAVRGINLPKG